MTTFEVIGADTLAAKQACAAAGVHGVLIQANWASLQPGGSGSALNASAVAALNQQMDDARSLGLAVTFEYAPQYAPGWALSSVEPYKDQNGVEYLSNDSGKQVRNWFWTASGRALLGDFMTKVYAAMTPANRNAIHGIKFGGGYYGELQYPVEFVSAPQSFYGYGDSMQNGTDLADGLSACPLPGYEVFSGTDAQDVLWINWYLSGVENFLVWQIDMLKSLGFTCRLYALHSGYSTRTNMARDSAGYRENFARGHDFTRAIGMYKNDPQVWPWSTWLGGPNGWDPPSVDSDQAAWKRLYATAAARGKHYLIGGENTGGESNAGMDQIVAEATGDVPPAGLIYADGQPQTGWRPFGRIMWLNYEMLTEGGGNATLDHLAEVIAASE